MSALCDCRVVGRLGDHRLETDGTHGTTVGGEVVSDQLLVQLRTCARPEACRIIAVVA